MSAPYAALDRSDFSRIATMEEHLLARLRRAVEARSGDENATLLHDYAAAAFHRLFDAAGAYDDAGARDGR